MRRDLRSSMVGWKEKGAQSCFVLRALLNLANWKFSFQQIRNDFKNEIVRKFNKVDRKSILKLNFISKYQNKVRKSKYKEIPFMVT